MRSFLATLLTLFAFQFAAAVAMDALAQPPEEWPEVALFDVVPEMLACLGIESQSRLIKEEYLRAV